MHGGDPQRRAYQRNGEHMAPGRRYPGEVELPRLLDELTRAAARVGIDVRMESFDPNLSDARRPRGGLCTVRGRRLILVDANGALPDQIATVAGALAQVDLDAIYMPPVVRATIGAHAAPGAASPRPAAPALRLVSPPRPAPPGRSKPRSPAKAGALRAATGPLPLVRARWRDEDDD